MIKPQLQALKVKLTEWQSEFSKVSNPKTQAIYVEAIKGKLEDEVYAIYLRSFESIPVEKSISEVSVALTAIHANNRRDLDSVFEQGLHDFALAGANRALQDTLKLLMT